MRNHVTVWIVKEWYVRPIAWILAGRNYVSGVDAFNEQILDPARRALRDIDRLHVLSHGNISLDPVTGAVRGRFIDMGGGDRLASEDFGADGEPNLGTPTEKFVIKLQQAMRPGGRLIFSACHQGDGILLRAISQWVRNDVLVSGYRKLGHPFGSGDIAFRNGVEEKP